jgi:hypothetical protein
VLDTLQLGSFRHTPQPFIPLTLSVLLLYSQYKIIPIPVSNSMPQSPSEVGSRPTDQEIPRLNIRGRFITLFTETSG